MTKRELLGNRMKILDILEQVVLLAFYIWFLLRLWPSPFSEVTLNLSFVVLSEGLVIVLLLIRRPTVIITTSVRDWLVAFFGTVFPLLVSRGGDPLMLNVGIGLMLFGIITHVGAKLSLFRSFGVVPANRGVKVKGLYAIVRHPMYAGYFYTHIGFLLTAPSLWNFGVYTCSWVLLLSRIFAEESILLRSPDYQEYKERVRYRLIPGVF